MGLKLILIFMMTLFLLAACSTKQFVILPDEEGNEQPLKEVGGWIFEHPRLIAYKEVGSLEGIANPNMFWITLEASYKISDSSLVRGDLNIDSAAVIVSEDTLWRFPTRVADFNDNNGKRRHKAFNFFGDQGLLIEPGVSSVKVVFNALMKNGDEVVSERQLEYVMTLEDKNLNLPGIQLRE